MKRFFALFVILGLSVGVLHATGSDDSTANNKADEEMIQELNALREDVERSGEATTEDESAENTEAASDSESS